MLNVECTQVNQNHISNPSHLVPTMNSHFVFYRSGLDLDVSDVGFFIVTQARKQPISHGMKHEKIGSNFPFPDHRFRNFQFSGQIIVVLIHMDSGVVLFKAYNCINYGTPWSVLAHAGFTRLKRTVLDRV